MSTATVPPPTTPALPPATDGKAVVLYDGACPFCRLGVSLVRRMDWFKTLTFHNARDVANLPKAEVQLVPKRLIEEMHVLTPDRKHAPAGFKAFRWMAWRLPLTALFAPFLYIPGVPWVGNKVYLWVAKNRFKLVPCKDGVCQLPPRK
jgi:predicted DCC family thiol-disulfide oxidoreductase YuxK